MNCPRDTELRLTKSNKTTLKCWECGGRWVNGADLFNTLGNDFRTHFKRALKQGTESKLMCPSKCQNLTESNIDGVTIDFCKTCEGIWLDRGEIELLKSLQQERNSRTTKRSNHDSDSTSALGVIGEILLTGLFTIFD